MICILTPFIWPDKQTYLQTDTRIRMPVNTTQVCTISGVTGGGRTAPGDTQEVTPDFFVAEFRKNTGETTLEGGSLRGQLKRSSLCRGR